MHLRTDFRRGRSYFSFFVFFFFSSRMSACLWLLTWNNVKQSQEVSIIALARFPSIDSARCAVKLTP